MVSSGEAIFFAEKYGNSCDGRIGEAKRFPLDGEGRGKPRFRRFERAEARREGEFAVFSAGKALSPHFPE